MSKAYTLRPLKPGDEPVLAAACAFAREPLFERLWLHGALEVDALRARAELSTASDGTRLVGLAAVLEGMFPFRFAAVDAALPGVAAQLVAALPRPFVCPVPVRLATELRRAGGRPIRSEWQMVRFASPMPGSAHAQRIERLSDAAELAQFLGPAFSPLELELGRFLGIRDGAGELAAVAGARFITPRIALLAHLDTREDCRRQGYARALAAAAVRALESDERRVVVQLREGEQAARALLAPLGFRGTHEFRVFAF
jgi:ribosomal protein S18 acetylase RimI-like enzyme